MASNRELNLILRLQDQVSQELQGIQGKFENLGKSLTSIGKELSLKVTAPLVGVGTAAFKTSGDFQKSLDQIVGLVGIARDEVNDWREDIFELSRVTGKSSKELADSLFFVTSAGFRGSDAIDTLTIAAKASAAGLGDTQSIADGLTSAINAYGIENLDAARAADILTATIREGKLESQSLTPVLGTLIPTASSLGIAFEDVMGTMAVLSRVGVDAAEGSTQLNSVMSALLSTSPQVNDALSEVGLTTEMLRKQAGEDGLVAVMRTLDEAFDGNVESMRMVIPNVRAFRGVMAALSQDGEVVSGILDGVSNSSGALGVAFEETENQTRTWSQLMGELQILLIELGDSVAVVLIPIIKDLTSLIRLLSESWGNLTPEVQETIIRILGVIAVIGPLLIVVGTIIKLLGLLVIGVKGVITIIASLGAAMVFLVTNPIGWLILAITALVATGWYLYKNWDDVKNGFMIIWGFITDIFSKAIDFIKDNLFWLLPGGLGIKLITENWEAIRDVFEMVWEAIVGIFQKASDRIKVIMDGIIKWAERAIQLAQRAISLAGEAASGAASRVTGTISSAASTVRGVLPFAEGGIVTRPTLGLVGEAGPEAIIPLSKMAMGGTNISINVYGDVSGEDLIHKVEQGILKAIKRDIRI